MEEDLFYRPAVAGQLRKVIEARLHTDGDKPAHEAIRELQRKLVGTQSMPTFLLVDPDTRAVIAGPLEGRQSEAEFLEFLGKAIKS